MDVHESEISLGRCIALARIVSANKLPYEPAISADPRRTDSLVQRAATALEAAIQRELRRVALEGREDPFDSGEGCHSLTPVCECRQTNE